MLYYEWAPKMMFVVTVVPMDDKWQVIVAFKRRVFRYGEPTLDRDTAYALADKLDAVIQEKLQ